LGGGNQLGSRAESGGGFHIAGADLQAMKHLLVYPGHKRFPLNADTMAIGFVKAARISQETL